MTAGNEQADVFISHAHEDKEVARPLAEALRQLGFTVWYDEYVLRLGDSLRRVIERGLATARFGVVILSPNFFAKHKRWTKYELDALLAMETAKGTKVLLPVWHNITLSEIVAHSPILADRLGVSTAEGIPSVVAQILQVLNTEGRPPLAPEPAATQAAPRQERIHPTADSIPGNVPAAEYLSGATNLTHDQDEVLRPTVLLGLGGTGHDLLLQVKRRLVERFGRVPACISLLSIDGAVPEGPYLQASDGQPVALDLTERILIQIASSESLTDGMNEHIAEWWPPNTSVSAITAGANQIRPRGRLGFFAEYSQIIMAIENAIARVTKVSNLKELDDTRIRPSDTLGIDVYILSSLAGGIGSGMLLDVAFNIRRLCDVPTTITGVLVLPGIFNQMPSIRQKPNTYAALKEIDFFMKLQPGQSFAIDYGESSVQVTKPPFDLAFLVDNLNEQGSSLSRDQLFSILGEGIYLMIASEVGTRSRNSLDNIKGKLSGGTLRARSVAYCSFGVASLTVDRKLSHAEARKLNIELLSDLASPLWSPDESKLPLPHDMVLETSCYGVYDAEEYRITLFRVKAGVPLFALRGMAELEVAYYRQANRASCHVDARWQAFPDLIPVQLKRRS